MLHFKLRTKLHYIFSFYDVHSSISLYSTPANEMLKCIVKGAINSRVNTMEEQIVIIDQLRCRKKININFHFIRVTHSLLLLWFIYKIDPFVEWVCVSGNWYAVFAFNRVTCDFLFKFFSSCLFSIILFNHIFALYTILCFFSFKFTRRSIVAQNGFYALAKICLFARFSFKALRFSTISYAA